MNRPYWDAKLETLPVAQRATLREHRLQWQVRRCWDGSPFYRARLEAAGLDPATFGGLRDWPRLPILRAADLPPDDPSGELSRAWSVAPDDWWVYEIASANGPTRAMTDGDLTHQIDLAARALWAAGGQPGVNLTWGRPAFDRMTTNTMSWAAQRIGLDWGFGPGQSLNRQTLVVIGLLPGERVGTSLHEVPGATFAVWSHIWPLRSRSSRTAEYLRGILSVAQIGPTVAYSCEAERRLHWNDDHFLVETVDRATGKPTRPGKAGALLLTDLTREGSPFLRFWTGLWVSLSDEPCPCGRTSAWSPSVRPLRQPTTDTRSAV